MGCELRCYEWNPGLARAGNMHIEKRNRLAIRADLGAICLKEAS